MSDQHRQHPEYQSKEPKPPKRPHAQGGSSGGGDMVCVTLQRPPHFWRFACAPEQTSDLLERLAEIADDPNIELTWADAELIASEIVIHHHVDTPSAGPSNDR